MLALSTAWNAWRHTSGKTLVDEILNLGFNRIELNFTISPSMFEEILSLQKKGKIEVTSLHNFLPLSGF